MRTDVVGNGLEKTSFSYMIHLLVDPFIFTFPIAHGQRAGFFSENARRKLNEGEEEKLTLFLYTHTHSTTWSWCGSSPPVVISWSKSK